MARGILSEYGPDASKTQRARAQCGGVEAKDVKPIPYSPPVGPKNINDPKTPGLHGKNHGNNPK